MIRRHSLLQRHIAEYPVLNPLLSAHAHKTNSPYVMPQGRTYFNKFLGIALTREEALASSMKEDFFAVADYIVEEDPAVNSYLMGQQINIRGRVCKH